MYLVLSVVGTNGFQGECKLTIVVSSLRVTSPEYHCAAEYILVSVGPGNELFHLMVVT